MLYAYKQGTSNGLYPCKQCGKDHYYVTKGHVVIIGTEAELQEANLPFDIVVCDMGKTDIGECENVFSIWPALKNN